ncbi:MAG TPA: hypothetical protein VHG91_02335 [Longimicrobium sp.]|nr:hypothetical protein [Longimicrobium sp.]
MAERYFLPGTDFRIRPEWRRPARPVFARARALAPGRLHFNVWDFSKMAPVVPGGGGLGCSTSAALSEIEVTAEGDGVEAPVPTAAHLARLMAEMVGYEGGLRISVPDRIAHVHSGYGSNVTFNTGVVAAVNALFGTPFSLAEMWDILTQNFVENADERHVYWGLDTGVGESCLLYGGLVWVDEHARHVGHADLDGIWVVTAAGDKAALANARLRALGQTTSRGVGDEEEKELLAIECQKYQAEFGERHTAFVERRLKPFLLRNDARGLLRLGWELNEIGTYQVLLAYWEPEILEASVRAAREAGSLYAMMSSAGPSLFALAEGRAAAERVRDALEGRFSGYFSSFAVGKAGVRLTVEVE